MTAPLTVVAWNTHVGVGIRTGGIGWILTNLRPDVLLLSEVQSPLARWRLRNALGRGWRLHGTRPPSTGRGASGTIVATRRTRLRFVTGTNALVSRYRDRMHPTRRNTVGWYVDRPTDRPLTLLAMHTWTLFGADGQIGAGHKTQVMTYAATCRAARADGAVVIAGGDVNERMTGAGTTPIEHELRRAGMYNTRDWTDNRPLLDGIWCGHGTHSSGWRVVPVPVAGVDHPAIVVNVAL